VFKKDFFPYKVGEEIDTDVFIAEHYKMLGVARCADCPEDKPCEGCGGEEKPKVKVK
jgi:hypothetical protein